MRWQRCPGLYDMLAMSGCVGSQASSATFRRLVLSGDLALEGNFTIRRRLPSTLVGLREQFVHDRHEEQALRHIVPSADRQYCVEYTGSFSDPELCADRDIVMHAVRHT